MTTVIIGLDRLLAEPIRERIRSPSNRVYIYDTIPQAYTKMGEFYIKHPSMDSTWLNPSAVIYYSYFPRAKGVRRSLALSNTPSYPPVQQTILHDNKVLSLVLRKNMGCLMPNDLPRGYIPSLVGVDFEREVVLKQGNKHCGENKKLFKGRHYDTQSSVLVEPLVKGESYRVLTIGKKAWSIHYQSKDWRKNVNGTQTLIQNNEWDQLYLEQGVKLGLPIGGWDFIINEDNRIIDLEVNCYPGIPEFAHQTFINEAVEFIEKSI